MSWPAYPRYHDTGIPELPTIPSNWNVCRLKHLATIRNGRDFKDIEVESGGYPVFGSGGPFAHASTYIFSGESVLLGRKGTIDKPLYVDQPFWTVDTMFYTEIGSNCHGRFLYYVARTIDFARYVTNTALPSMAQADLANVYCPAPGLLEQRQIADFLDHETARIDALIEEQQRLIDLLQEKRQAVISHAVTKGLDPDVPMKDSGVYWLGEVPEHWSVTRLKFEVTHVVDCLHSTPSYTDEGEYPAIRTADIYVGYLDLNNCKTVDMAEYQYRVGRLVPRAGDIVYSREGERYGIAAPIPSDTHVCLGQRVMMFRVSRHNRHDYFMFALNSASTYDQARVDVIGATAPHINVETIENFWLLRPPAEEQEKIGSYLTNVMNKFDSLREEALRLIELMREHRSALISGAITGKIDVRGWKPQATPANHDLPQAAETEAQYG